MKIEGLDESQAAAELDLVALAELQELLEDDFPDLIRSYLTDAQASIPIILAECEKRDFESLRRSAHSQKGSALNIGAPGLAKLWALVEDEANASPANLARLHKHIDAASSKFSVVSTELQSLLHEARSL